MTDPKKIKAMRIMRGWTQKELAQRLTVSDVTVSNWERGKSAPNPASRAALKRLIKGES